MRSIRHLNKLIVFFSIVFFIFLASCHHHLTKSEILAPQVIFIIDGDTTSGKLEMQDVNEHSADTFKVSRGQTIKWMLGHNQIITKITNIYKKDSSENVFSVGPDSVGGSSLNWVGTIDVHAAGKTEEYNIDWIGTDGNSHTFDPFIQVKPHD